MTAKKKKKKSSLLSWWCHEKVSLLGLLICNNSYLILVKFKTAFSQHKILFVPHLERPVFFNDGPAVLHKATFRIITLARSRCIIGNGGSSRSKSVWIFIGRRTIVDVWASGWMWIESFWVLIEIINVWQFVSGVVRRSRGWSGV